LLEVYIRPVTSAPAEAEAMAEVFLVNHCTKNSSALVSFPKSALEKAPEGGALLHFT
jgi:hypothetical protein